MKAITRSAFWDLYDTLTFPDMNFHRCTCQVCGKDIWEDRRNPHEADCELETLAKLINQEPTDYEESQ